MKLEILKRKRLRMYLVGQFSFLALKGLWGFSRWMHTYSQRSNNVCVHMMGLGSQPFTPETQLPGRQQVKNSWALLAQTGWIRSQRSKQRDCDHSAYLFVPRGYIRSNIILYLNFNFTRKPNIYLKWKVLTQFTQFIETWV